MATLYSLEYANSVAIPRIKNPTNNLSGKVRVLAFSFATAAATPIASGDTIQLGKLPKAARIVGGRVTYGAMGMSAVLSIGVTGTTTKYLSSLDVSAAGSSDFGNTQTLNILDTLTAETLIIATAGGANYANSKTLLGYILYFQD